MNKTTLIVIIVLVAVGIGVSSAYAITIKLAGDATVTGNLDVAGVMTGPTITAINNAIASGAICPQENIEHWDKIIFAPLVVMENFAGNTPNILEASLFEYDIKVLDNPDEVAFLEEKVANKLNGFGYRILGQQSTLIIPQNIFVIEVQYAIICAEIPQ